jgi:hypothetical protein
MEVAMKKEKERYAVIDRSGHFKPFLDVTGDFNFDELASRLELGGLQRQLLSYWLSGLEINVWFDELEGRPPTMSVNVFMPSFERHVSSCDLLTLLEDSTSDFINQIGAAEEIVALDKLRDLCDRGIAVRRDHLKEAAVLR